MTLDRDAAIQNAMHEISDEERIIFRELMGTDTLLSSDFIGFMVSDMFTDGADAKSIRAYASMGANFALDARDHSDGVIPEDDQECTPLSYYVEYMNEWLESDRDGNITIEESGEPISIKDFLIKEAVSRRIDKYKEPEVFNPELLSRCSEYICQFLGYERPQVCADDKGPFPYPAIIPELYQRLHDSLLDREHPVSNETLAAYGLKAIYKSVNSNGAKNPDELLQNSMDDQDEADCISLFGGTK